MTGRPARGQPEQPDRPRPSLDRPSRTDSLGLSGAPRELPSIPSRYDAEPAGRYVPEVNLDQPASPAPPAPRLTHIDAAGQARMVDVSGKDVTARAATASGRVLLSPAAVAALRDGAVPKGDALAVARIAGIQGAKRTPDLIPLCHPIGLHSVTVDLEVHDDGVRINATTRTADRTGVEMEALTAVAVAGLALIDMIKAIDPAAVISDVRVEEKAGGKTGGWRRS
jgi:cyclic pyranopterin monophosphate synthase